MGRAPPRPSPGVQCAPGPAPSAMAANGRRRRGALSGAAGGGCSWRAGAARPGAEWGREVSECVSECGAGRGSAGVSFSTRAAAVRAGAASRRGVCVCRLGGAYGAGSDRAAFLGRQRFRYREERPKRGALAAAPAAPCRRRAALPAAPRAAPAPPGPPGAALRSGAAAQRAPCRAQPPPPAAPRLSGRYADALRAAVVVLLPPRREVRGPAVTRGVRSDRAHANAVWRCVRPWAPRSFPARKLRSCSFCCLTFGDLIASR